MKRIAVILSVVSCLIGSVSFGQTSFGAFTYVGKTSIHNSGNINAGSIYNPKFTVSPGGGFYWMHHFTDKKFGNRRLHGRMLSSFVASWYLRLGGSFQSHNQAWSSKFYHYWHGYKLEDRVGRKRSRYSKIFAYMQRSFPLVHLKKWNAYWYGGVNVAYNTRSGGGIITWVESNISYEGLPVVHYYDLPPYDRQYYKKFLVEAAGGAGLTYKPSSYINVNIGVHSDWSVSRVENNDIILWGTPEAAWTAGGVYDRRNPRKNSRLSNLAMEIGVEYTFHQGEHARAKF